MSLDRIPGDANLYISGLYTVRQKDVLKAANITHIVSALPPPFEKGLFKGFKHHAVDVDDSEEQNIIQYFPTSNEFIRKGLEGGGGVLIHCGMGKSRSAALVIAYLLSAEPRRPTNTPETKLALVRQARRFAEPNPGFMKQLSLYYRLNTPSTVSELESHPGYQEWLFQCAVEESNMRGVAPEVQEIWFADTSPPPPADTTAVNGEEMDVDTESDSKPQASPAAKEPLLSYRCRRCRHQLATSNYVLDHAAGDTINFAARSNPLTALKTFGLTDPADRCAHLFVEPLSWMRPELEQGKIEGRFECPNSKCRNSVGRYAWQGMRCSCGAWVVPGVSLGWAKIDEIKATVQPVRTPPGAGGKI